ncbi:MAG: ABC transporter ATP-binding protein [Streptosporangiales bacterium]
MTLDVDRANDRASDTTAALELDDVSKRYGETVAIDNVGFVLRKGEFLTLLGPSGSGKTTTLKIVAGFEEPDTGAVRIRGTDVTAYAPQHRNIGMVFQHYALFPHMTVEQNIAFPLVMRKASRTVVREKVDRVLAMVHLEGLGGRHPRQLSGGQQQRVALARAMVFEPELLLMDEPLGALDKKLRERLQVEIMRIQRETGITVMYVTHDQEEALVMSDRIAIYHDGNIEQMGDAESLYESPQSLFVADFIGESNIFTGPVAGSGDTAQLQAGDLRVPVRADGDGGDVGVIVRPERVRLHPGDDDVSTAAGTVTAPGVVTSALYLGSSRKYIVTLDGGQEVTSLCHPGESWADFSVDDRVYVQWRVDDSVTVAA